jgi:hypothetical protein
LNEAGHAGAEKHAVEEVVASYHEVPAETILAPEYALAPKDAEAITLDLPPERDDEFMSELLGILKENGIKNVMSVVEKLDRPHITDDFHRILVEFLKEGHSVAGLKEKTPLAESLRMTLYEITFPSDAEKGADVHFKELIATMEQFYAGMLTGSGKHDDQYADFTIEIAVADGTQEIIFYVGVPQTRAGLFEKQAVALFPHAHIREEKSDYNIFVDGGITLASSASLAEKAILPLKTYDTFEADPLSVLLTAFSKIEKHNAGAAIQFVFHRADGDFNQRYQRVIEKMEKGEKFKDAYRAIEEPGMDLLHSFASSIGEMTKNRSKEDIENEKLKEKTVDSAKIEMIRKKIEMPITFLNVRMVASASEKSRTEDILRDIESSFGQFANSGGNHLLWRRIERGSAFRSLLNTFTFREFSKADALPLSYREAASLVHFPAKESFLSPEFKQAKAGAVAAPLGLSVSGTLLGVNRYRGVETPAYLTAEDRLRHLYAIGQTGTGKTTLLKNMIIQDIQAGNGVCFIDPHGSDIIDILAAVPKERHEDVIYFDPAYMDRVMGLNMLEYDPRYPEQKTFVVNELFSIFKKLYGAVPESMGPAFEQYFRNATLLVLEDPQSGMTLLDVSRVLADQRYRALKLSRSKNMVINQFWQDIASKAQGESALANIVPYITNKFDIFTANDYMRPIIAQERSAFRFREVMDTKKILLVNLSKGRLGDINANLIGLILVGKILMAALSRVDSIGGDIPPFYLYIDEFQNITTNSIATILSEARKYKLGLTIAHQFIAQLEDDIRSAVFGNVGSMAAFRVGPDDGAFLEKQFEPAFTARDLMNIDNRNAYIRILADGKPTSPFNIQTMAPPAGDSGQVELLRQLSYMKFGRPRAEVEAEIQKRFQKEAPAPSPFERAPLT